MSLGADSAIAGAAYLSDIRIWSAEMKHSARRWMRNFTESEQEFAAAILDSFIYFSAELVDRLFVAAFDALAVEVIRPQASDYRAKKADWLRFRDEVLVTHPTGEMPNVTDSGYAFDRRARQRLGIPQAHILEPEAVIARLLTGLPAPVVFVDDFVGSGDQFVKTWTREYTIAGQPHSFASLAASGGGRFFYCPLICTAHGASVIKSACPDLSVRPAHLLPGEYSAKDPNSLVWPDSLRPGATAFVEEASRRAGISAYQVWGYRDLGLLVAFEHGVPDATLPMMWWEENGWVPLVRLR